MSVSRGRSIPKAYPAVLPRPKACMNPKQKPLVVIIEDVVQLLDGVSEGLRKGHYPDKKLGSNVARALRGLADQLDA